jgi:hypothetical protein
MRCWEKGCIFEIQQEHLPPMLQNKFDGPGCLARTTTGGSENPKPSIHYVGVTKAGGREYCDCVKWEQTGKRCAHLWAFALHRTCGPIRSFEDKMAAGNRMDGRGDEDDGPDPEPNEDDEEDYVEYWGGPPVDLIGDEFEIEPPVRVPPQSPSKAKRMSTMLEGAKTNSIDASPHSKPSTASNVLGPSASELSVGGRPASLKPLEPSRSRRRKKKRKRADSEPVAPVGAVNRGVDCWALSLFQVLSNNELWCNTMQSQESLVHMRPSRMAFERFLEVKRSGRPQMVEDLTQLLDGTSSNCLGSCIAC